MRRCAVCGTISKKRRCPEDGVPTLRVVKGTGKEIQPGSVLSDRFEIKELIGQGGFGKVFGVADMRNGMNLAVKVLSPAFNAEGEEATLRFVREAYTTSRLTHGNTIRVYDYGQTQNGQLFLVMERLVGEPLSDRLKDAKAEKHPLAAANIVSIGVGVLQSLAEAHKQGLVHRDMKPENIFMHRLGNREIVKVLDFGIVREKGSAMTQAGQPIGTPSHMSPEQAIGRGEVDGRSDLYSLGVVLYELAALQLPIDKGANALMTMMAHVTQPAKPLSETAPDLDPDVAEVIMKSLAKDAKDRYQSATEMRDALRGCSVARSKRRISQLTVTVDKKRRRRTSGRARREETYALLQERRISRLSLNRLPSDVQIGGPPPTAPPPMEPAPVKAVQGDSASVSSKSPPRRRLHMATTQRLAGEKVKAEIAAIKARKDAEAEKAKAAESDAKSS